MDKTTIQIGFLGMGNMAQAIATGLIEKAGIRGPQLKAYAPHQDKLRDNAAKIGFIPCSSVRDAVSGSDFVIIACKPYQIEGLLDELGDALNGKAVLSIALGWNLERYRSVLEDRARIQFVMPNTPAQVGEGVFLFEAESTFRDEEKALWKQLFAAMGLVEELPARLMGVGGALTGCGPAFVDLMIEAYADAAVSYGIPRDKAYQLTSQMILGSAKLQLVSKKTPGELKDAVCSPGGSTIRGVMALEKNGYRAACISAIVAAVDGDKKPESKK